MRLQRALRRSVVVVLLAAAVLGVYTWRHWSGAAPTYVGDAQWASIPIPLRFRTGPEHDAARTRNGGEPYVLEVATGGDGAILYYGGSHTRSADHPQIADITARWERFGPTVALLEGRARGFFYGALIEPFAGLPEPALVHKLARRDGVPIYSLEPAYEDEVAALLGEFAPERVALYFFLRVYVSEAGGRANEDLATDLLAKRTDVAGLRGVRRSVAALDDLWHRDFPAGDDWRTLTAEPDIGYIPLISEASRRIRGEHMVRTVTDLARKGERVFAVVGSGHVIRQEWSLRALFGMEPAEDQPLPEGEAVAPLDGAAAR